MAAPSVIALTGFMGCGKTRIGQALAESLGWPWVDLDEVVCRRNGCSIPELFGRGGEPLFRRLEAEALADLLGAPSPEPMILSLGGGTLTSPACARLVKERTRCIYLEAGPDTLADNLRGDTTRPMLQETDTGDAPALRRRIGALLAEREPVYRAAADRTVRTDGKTEEEIVREIREAGIR